MRRDAGSCPPRNMGAGRSENRVSLTAGNPLRSCRFALTHKTSRLFSTLAGHWLRSHR